MKASVHDDVLLAAGNLVQFLNQCCSDALTGTFSNHAQIGVRQKFNVRFGSQPLFLYYVIHFSLLIATG